jgi:hypothetical protein
MFSAWGRDQRPEQSPLSTGQSVFGVGICSTSRAVAAEHRTVRFRRRGMFNVQSSRSWAQDSPLAVISIGAKLASISESGVASPTICGGRLLSDCVTTSRFSGHCSARAVWYSTSSYEAEVVVSPRCSSSSMYLDEIEPRMDMGAEEILHRLSGRQI